MQVPINHKAAPWCSALGLLLLIIACPASDWVGNKWPLIHGIFALLYGLALFPILLYASQPRFTLKQRLRFWLIAIFFTLSLYSSMYPDSIYHITYAAGLLGLLLLSLGLWHWPKVLIILENLTHKLTICLHRPRLSAFLLSIAIGGITIALAWICFKFKPAIVDSIAQYVHAKYMMQGMLYGPEPYLRDFFPVWMAVVMDGKFFAQYQPLHIALLAIGHLMHAPWVINPLATAITLFATYALANRIFGKTTAVCAAFFMLGSQFILFIAAEYMNHASALCFGVLFMLSYIYTCDAIQENKRTHARILGLATGTCLSAVILIRPLSALGISFPFILYSLILIRSDWKRYIAPFTWASAAIISCLIFQAWYNFQISGSIFLFPSSVYYLHKLSLALGFSNDTPFSIVPLLQKAQQEWFLMNRVVFEWPIPCLTLLVIYLLRPSKNIYARLLFASIVSMTVFNMVNQFNSNVFGPRYLYDTNAAFIILSAAGLLRLPILLSALPLSPPRNHLKGLCNSICLLLFTLAIMIRFPMNIHSYANHYFDNDPAFYQSMLSQSYPPSLIFMGRMSEEESKDSYLRDQPYRKVSFTYPPDEKDDTIFAKDLGDEKNQKLIQHFPGRHVYVEEHGHLTLQDPNKNH